MVERRISGPRSHYRGKVRRPIVLTFTPEGHAALADGTLRTGLSRADYIERLLRRAHSRVRKSGEESGGVGTSELH